MQGLLPYIRVTEIAIFDDRNQEISLRLHIQEGLKKKLFQAGQVCDIISYLG